MKNIVVFCAWCGRYVRGERENPDAVISHGICAQCYQTQIEALTSLKAVGDK